MQTFFDYKVEFYNGETKTFKRGQIAQWGWTQGGLFLYIEMPYEVTKDTKREFKTKVRQLWIPAKDIKSMEGFTERVSVGDDKEIKARKSALIGDNNA